MSARGEVLAHTREGVYLLSDGAFVSACRSAGVFGSVIWHPTGVGFVALLYEPANGVDRGAELWCMKCTSPDPDALLFHVGHTHCQRLFRWGPQKAVSLVVGSGEHAHVVAVDTAEGRSDRKVERRHLRLPQPGFVLSSTNGVSPSPDGRLAALVVCDPDFPGTSRVWRYDLVREEGVPMTPPSLNAAHPAWCPAGGRIAFTALRGALPEGDVLEYAVAVREALASNRAPAEAPVGRPRVPRSDLWVCDHDGHRLVRVARQVQSVTPAWHPSGEFVYFLRGNTLHRAHASAE